MKKCNANNLIQRNNSDHCIMYEFPIEDKDINFAVANITSRYPEKGLATNTICKEIVYVQNGAGKIVIDNKECILKKGDVILVLPNEQFYWDGNMTLHIACTPAFTPEQHIHISE